MEYLLPNTIFPKLYNVVLETFLKTKTFKGSVSVKCEVKKETEKIIFHGLDLEIEKDSLKITQGKEIFTVKSFEYNKEKQFFIVTLDKKLKVDGELVVKMKYSSKLNEKLMGYYLSKYGDNKYLAVTQFEPCDARRAFPCWDEPSFKARFQFSMLTSSTEISLCNTPCNAVLELKSSNQKKYVFDTSPVMSTYLVAFLVVEEKDFVFVEGETKNGVKVRICSTPIDDIKKLYFARDNTIKVIDYYDSLFQIPYKSMLPKCDIVLVENFAAGAMENYGLITFRRSYLEVDEKTSLSAKKRSASVISHEVSHQWFGNIVTFKWWNDLWLNEGFARYLENYAVEALHPNWKMFDGFQGPVSNAFSVDSLDSTHAINVKVHTPEQINEIFDVITYCKGGALIRHLVDYIGHDKFFEAIRKYLYKYKWSNTVSDNLMEVLGEVTGKDIGKIMKTWTEQKGFPIITAKLEGKKLVFEQERFLRSGRSKCNSLWNIPIRIKYQRTEESVTILMTEKKISIDLPENYKEGDWIKVNFKQNGYYRVNYSKDLLKALITPIKKKELGVLDRLQVIADLFSLGNNNSYEIKLPFVLDYLSSAYEEEDSYYVVEKINGCLLKLKGLFNSPEYKKIFEGLKKILVSINKKIYTKLGESLFYKGNDDLEKLLHKNVVSSLYECDYEIIVKELNGLFKKLKEDHKQIDSDLKGRVLDSYIKFGTEKEWEELKDMYEKTDDYELKKMIMMSLTCSQKEGLIDKVIDYLLVKQNVKIQDLFYPVHGIARNIVSREKMWAFFKKNWESLFIERLGKANFVLSYCAQLACVFFNTKEKAKEVEDFFKVNGTPSVERTVKQTIESIISKAKEIEGLKDLLGKHFN